MNKVLVVMSLCCSMLVMGCNNNPDHDAERKAVCAHSEGAAAGECNAGDSFSPLTCEETLSQFESWWRGDAQTDVNDCMVASACYPSVEGPGPSISQPLEVCLEEVLLSVLKPTDGEKKAAASYCEKASACGELGSFTVADCEDILLNPNGEGELFLLMGDDLAAAIQACNTSSCANYGTCVDNALTSAGAFSGLHGSKVRMPAFLSH